MIKKAMVLIPLLLLMLGCGSFTKIRTTPFQGSSGYSISGKIKKLDREQGVFTLQVNIDKIWYEGNVDVYRERGMMLGSLKVTEKHFPKVTQKSHPQSLFDFENDLTIEVLEKSGPSHSVAIPFKSTLLSDDLIKFKVDRRFFGSSVKDIFVNISLDRKNTVTTIKKDRRSYGQIEESTVQLASRIELCLTCSANKGV